MIKLIDRLMIRGYFKAYFVCLTSLLSLYVVVDLFMNLDDFTHRHRQLHDVLLHIASYYTYKVTEIFDRLCESIVLLAAMFTVAWMQRNNEQVPLLSAGVSTRRIVAPVLLCACVMLTLTVLNQEFIMPRIAHKLVLQKDDPDGEKEISVRSVFDTNGVHFEGEKASRKGMMVKTLRCTIPESLAGIPLHLTAEEAHFIPGAGPHEGKWELTRTKRGAFPAEVDGIAGVLDPVDKGRYYLHTRAVDFEALTRDPKWFQLAATSRLYEELQRPESQRLSSMAVLFHMRLTRPILGLLLVFLGLSIILRDQNRNVIISSGMCLVLCAVFFATTYTCKMLGDNDYLNPALAAWLPVLCFGPYALALFDAVHT